MGVGLNVGFSFDEKSIQQICVIGLGSRFNLFVHHANDLAVAASQRQPELLALDRSYPPHNGPSRVQSISTFHTKGDQLCARSSRMYTPYC